MKKNKLTYIVSDIDKAISFEWVALGLQPNFDLLFILLGNRKSAFAIWLENKGIRVNEITPGTGKFLAWLRLVKLLWKENPEVVHTHLWRANLLGLSAAWLLRIKKRIYTRHHATIHYDEFPSGRKWDIMCNFFATEIIAISKNIECILIERDKASPSKIRYIPHGFDFEYFLSADESRITKLKAKYNISNEKGPIIGVIARYMKWKGVQYIIEAFKDILIKYPSAKLILANAYGSYEKPIKDLLKKINNQSYLEIRFEEDLATLYKLFDVYVHVPTDEHSEAFGQTYVEALICKVPSIFTLSGIAREFVVHKLNAWIVEYKNSKEIAQAIEFILKSPDLRNELKSNGYNSIQQFSIEQHILALKQLYIV